jgi:hypothetical protein
VCQQNACLPDVVSRGAKGTAKEAEKTTTREK